jgi:hypothetical protein
MNLTDELTALPGQPAEVVAPVNVMTEPTAPTAPVEVKQEVPTKYGGKTVEDLAREMAEKDDYIASVNERASRAEHEAQLTRNLVEQFARGQGRPQEDVPKTPEVSDDEFLTNPAKATSKIIESYFARDKAEREQEKTRQYVDTARTAYEEGKAGAIKANPNLYRGIEADLSREVSNSVLSSLKAGQPVDASALKNPKYWEAAAVAMRIMGGEDVSKYYERKVHTPMTPAYTETPSAGGPPKAEVTLTPEQEFIISKGNVTREAFMEAQKKVRNIAEEKNR